MKRPISFVLCAALLFVICFSPVRAENALEAAAHSETTPYNWYCKHMKNGEIPPCDASMKFVEKYDGYYLDKKVTEENKKIYLTFDAGYENGNVEKIVDVMKEKNVTGAFFVLDNIITANPDLMKKIADGGNLICNHTAKHKDMTLVAEKADFEAELHSLENTLRDTCNIQIAPYYRPPEGRFSEQNLKWAKEMGYSTIFWSFAYVDWDNNHQMSKEAAMKKITDSLHNGEILLLHPTSSTNAEIIGELIDTIRNAGYSFGTLDELCGKGG